LSSGRPRTAGKSGDCGARVSGARARVREKQRAREKESEGERDGGRGPYPLVQRASTAAGITARIGRRRMLHGAACRPEEEDNRGELGRLLLGRSGPAFGPEQGREFFSFKVFLFCFPNKTPILIYLKIQTSFKILIYSWNLWIQVEAPYVLFANLLKYFESTPKHIELYTKF
jgi:hypothetical protein